MENGYTNWGLGQPNNEGNCLYIDKIYKIWNDFNCDDTDRFKPLCQIIPGEFHFHSCFVCYLGFELGSFFVDSESGKTKLYHVLDAKSRL